MDVKEMNFPDLEPGQVVTFSVALNAVRRKTIQIDGARRTKIQPVPEDHDNEALENGETTITPWLQGKLSTALEEIQVVNHLRDILHDSGSGGVMTIQVDSIDGVAQVKDPIALKELLATGIGREKAYGCGLLSVRAV
jgi:CRISPR system Cascade subunit CasE